MVFWFLVSWVYVITVWSGSETLFVVVFSPELFGWDEYDRILVESELDLIFAELSARRVTERARVGSHKFNVELSQWVMGAVLLGEWGKAWGGCSALADVAGRNSVDYTVGFLARVDSIRGRGSWTVRYGVLTNADGRRYPTVGADLGVGLDWLTRKLLKRRLGKLVIGSVAGLPLLLGWGCHRVVRRVRL